MLQSEKNPLPCADCGFLGDHIPSWNDANVLQRYKYSTLTRLGNGLESESTMAGMFSSELGLDSGRMPYERSQDGTNPKGVENGFVIRFIDSFT